MRVGSSICCSASCSNEAHVQHVYASSKAVQHGTAGLELFTCTRLSWVAFTATLHVLRAAGFSLRLRGRASGLWGGRERMGVLCVKYSVHALV